MLSEKEKKDKAAKYDIALSEARCWERVGPSKGAAPQRGASRRSRPLPQGWMVAGAADLAVF